MNARFARSRLGYVMRHRLVKAGVVACLAAAMALAVAAGYWWPAQRADTELAERLTAERRALVEMRQAGESARNHARNLRDVPLLEAKLAAAGDQTQIVDGLARLARAHRIRIVNQSYAERRDNTGLVVDLAVEGAYGSVRNFIHGLATLPVWIELHEAQLDRGGDAAGVKSQLRLVSFGGRRA